MAARTRIRRRRAHGRPDRRPLLGQPGDRSGAKEDHRPAADEGTRLLRERPARPVHGGAVSEAGIPSVAIWGERHGTNAEPRFAIWRPGESRSSSPSISSTRVSTCLTVDTLLMLRPTDSPTLFLQQLGRGLRKTDDKSLCTVLDFVGQHRKEFRYDRRFRALLGGTRSELVRQVEAGFPFLPAGCRLELDPVAQETVLRSIRNAIPSRWRDKCDELRSLGDVSLGTYLTETGLELEDVYAGSHTWTEMRRAAGLPTAQAGPDESALLRAVGRLVHVDDDERIAAYRSFALAGWRPDSSELDERARRKLRMLLGSLTTLPVAAPMERAIDQLWAHPQVRVEIGELLDVLPGRVDHLHPPLGLDPAIPLTPARPVHATGDPGGVRSRRRSATPRLARGSPARKGGERGSVRLHPR